MMGDIDHFARQEFEDLRYIGDLRLFCILTVQRSGSTMVSRILTQDGSFGIVDEHVNRAQVHRRQGKPLPTTVREWSAPGRRGEDMRFGLKLMHNQLPVLGAWVTPPEEALALIAAGGGTVSHTFAVKAIAWLRGFGSLHVVRLRRLDLFAQAYSRVKAEKSGIYHRLSSGEIIDTGKREAVSPADIDPAQIASQIALLIREYRAIGNLLPADIPDTLDMVYEDIVDGKVDPLEAAHELVGNSGEGVKSVPSTAKLVDRAELEDMRRRFLSAIGLGESA